MAEEWIRVNAKLLHHPKLFRIANYLLRESDLTRWATMDCPNGVIEDGVAESIALCGLLRTWCAANELGHLDGEDMVMGHSTLGTIDSISRIVGFGSAMAHVGWAIAEDGPAIRFPNFLTYNIPAEERRRIKDRERKQRTRNGKIADIVRTECGQKGVQNRTEQNRTIKTTTLADAAVASPPKDSPSRKKPKPEKPPREPDPIWDKLAEVFYPSGVAPSQESSMGRAVRDLKFKHATPEEIARRVARWPTVYPDASFPKIYAFVDLWDALGREALPGQQVEIPFHLRPENQDLKAKYG